MPIFNLELSNSGPFDHIKFDFDRQVNVFVGPNNSGKSTVLSVLGDIAVFPFFFPTKYLRTQPSKFKVKFRGSRGRPKTVSGEVPIRKSTDYWTTARLKHWVAVLHELEYAVFVPALRESSNYRSPGPTSSAEGRKEDSFTPFALTLSNADRDELIARRGASFGESGYRADDKDLIQCLVDLDYRAYREDKPLLRELIDKVATIASEITDGYSIKFDAIRDDDGGLVPKFLTPDGVMSLGSLSQGTYSILHTIFQIILSFARYYGNYEDVAELPGILLIDEIDAHLHPSWQRRFLPAMIKSFPNIQIFCSTHSPLILSGLAAGQIQLLKREPGGEVSVSRTEYDIRGWSADEVLHSLLNVLSSTDLETDELVGRLDNLERIRNPSEEIKNELTQLRRQVAERLINDPTAAQLKRFADTLRVTEDAKVSFKERDSEKGRDE
ncbi:MAG: AAA family ATPase [Deltaproteobacteria bacterium]|nr:AAA family ATPase [Deltaproteobacteria bacterium]